MSLLGDVNNLNIPWPPGPIRRRPPKGHPVVRHVGHGEDRYQGVQGGQQLVAACLEAKHPGLKR